MPNGQTGIRGALPVIKVDNTDNADLTAGLQSLSIKETTEGLYTCEALVNNWGDVGGRPGYLYFDRRTVEFGKSIAVSFDGATLFNGLLMAMEAQFPEGGGAGITLLCEDRFQDLRMTRRSRCFENQSDADVFRSIASDHGLGAQVQFSGPTHKIIAQVNQTDLAFLRQRAMVSDVELWIDGSDLHAQTHGSRGGRPVQLSYPATLREFSVCADIAGQRTGIVVSGWDIAAKAALSYEATDQVISGELNAMTSGPSILSSKRGTRKATVAHLTPHTQQETQAVAESLFKEMARRFVRGVGVAETSGDIHVGATVDLQNLGPLFSGRYYVTEATHLFDREKGIRTEITVERPGLGQP